MDSSASRGTSGSGEGAQGRVAKAPSKRGRHLFRVHAWDPSTFTGVLILVAIVAALAVWLPARRASRVDPIVALRYE